MDTPPFLYIRKYIYLQVKKELMVMMHRQKKSVCKEETRKGFQRDSTGLMKAEK